MKYLVLGGGLQGPAVAYALAKHTKHGEVYIAEKDKARCDRVKWQFKKQLELDKTQGVIVLKVEEKQPVLDLFHKEKEFTVISTLPYSMNFGIAKQCIDKGWRYYDLGGNIESSAAIADYSQRAKKGSTMTDIGLAPGIVNIMGQYAIGRMPKCTSLIMMCGGLPVDPSINELNYGIVFSTEGLVNEYFNKCEIVIDGEIKEVKPMGNIHLELPYGGDKYKYAYEAFNTSGGAHTTLDFAIEKGLKGCAYQTLRYEGHAKIIRFLKYTIGMTNKEIAALLEEKIGRISEDKVMIRIKAYNDEGASFVIDNQVYHDEYFTAMQRSTGFSAAAIVLSTQDCNKNVIKYEDVDINILLSKLQPLIPEISI